MTNVTSAKIVRDWRDANPYTQLTKQILLDTLGLETLRGADLQGTDLRGVNLAGEDLRNINLSGSNMSGAVLTGSDLRWAKLVRAYLRGVEMSRVNMHGATMNWTNMSHVNLRQATLDKSELRRASLYRANLTGVSARDTNLYGANLCMSEMRLINLQDSNLDKSDLDGSNLSGAGGSVLSIVGLHHYQCILKPTPRGWRVDIGCWRDKTVNELQELINGDKWPSAIGAEVDDLRPRLQTFINMSHAHMEAHHEALEIAQRYWTTDGERKRLAMSEPRKYRKRPVEIEAMQFAGSASDAHAVYSWVERNTAGIFEPLDVIEGRRSAPASGVSIDPRDGRMIIATLEGLHWADPGDWIIRGVQGEFYPCKPDIFAQTYEDVDNQT